MKIYLLSAKFKNSNLLFICKLLVFVALYQACTDVNMVTIQSLPSTPHGFSLSGDNTISGIKVFEVPATEKDPFVSFHKNDKLLWSIICEENAANKWPAIMYEHIPSGCQQEFPLSGKPQALVKDKIYIIIALHDKNSIFPQYFIIEDGKILLKAGGELFP